MRTSWNQMIVLGSVALFFTAYAPQDAVAQEQPVEAPKGKQEVKTPKKELLNETNEMQSLVPKGSTLTPEEEIKLRVEEKNVFDEQVPG
ncbi:MAG: hypothetical protein K2X28_02305 [Alphaproteobacteria bacterium]|nr:hypothetical protein [Alphaproteobacteria bacterium]